MILRRLICILDGMEKLSDRTWLILHVAFVSITLLTVFLVGKILYLSFPRHVQTWGCKYGADGVCVRG